MVWLFLAFLFFNAFIIVCLWFRPGSTRLDEIVKQLEKERVTYFKKKQIAFFEKYMNN